MGCSETHDIRKGQHISDADANIIAFNRICKVAAATGTVVFPMFLHPGACK